MATAVWRGQLTFGLLTFPVKLYAAARRETISFRNLRKRDDDEPEATSPPRAEKQIALATKDPEPEPVYTAADRVVYQSVGPATASVTPQAPPPIVKGYEFEKDRYVAIDPAEIKKLARGTSKELEVTEFVHWEEIDPTYLDASYYVVPDPSGEKPYSLLCAAMKKTAFAALAQLVMHGREQILVLRLGAKGLVGHTMYYASEVRRDQEFAAGTESFNAKEVQLASALIEQMAGPFQPERYVDAYKQRVRELIEAKVNRVSSEPAEVAAPVTRKPPVDILDALKRSLEIAAQRKQPQKEAHRSKRKSA